MAVFQGAWNIGSGLPGGQALNLHLTVGTANGVVYGTAEMYFDYPGHAFSSCVSGNLVKSVIPGGTANGYVFNLHGSLVGSPIENLRVQMKLGAEMKSGIASYSYVDSGSGWVNMPEQKVSFENPPGPEVYTSGP